MLATHSGWLAQVGALGLLAARLVVALVFLRAGAVKLFGLADFRLAIANYDIVPARLIGTTAVFIPVAEVLAGAMLILGILPGVAAALTAALLVIFSASIAVNLARGRAFDCGCQGVASGTIGWSHVVSNSVFAFCATAIALAPPTGMVLLPGPAGVFRTVIPPGATLPVMLATILGLVVASVLRAAAKTMRLTAGMEA